MSKGLKIILVLVIFYAILLFCCFIATGIFIYSINYSISQATDVNNRVQMELDGDPYSTPAASSAECTSYETYNFTKKSCDIDCNSNPECSDLLEKVNQELDAKYSLISNDISNYQFPEKAYSENDPYIVYQLYPGENLRVKEQLLPEGELERAVASIFKAVFPDEVSDRNISVLRIHYDPDSDSTAYVIQDISNPNYWEVTVNVGAFEENYVSYNASSELAYTMVHELAHIITLDSTQVNYFVNENNCNTYYVDEGCLYPKAILGDFYSEFWEDRYSSNLLFDSEELFAANPDDFISDYAATNLEEDIAESFAAYVFLGSESDGSEIKFQKLQFFNEYPELVQIRTEIRTEINPLLRNSFRN